MFFLWKFILKTVAQNEQCDVLQEAGVQPNEPVVE